MSNPVSMKRKREKMHQGSWHGKHQGQAFVLCQELLGATGRKIKRTTDSSLEKEFKSSLYLASALK